MTLIGVINQSINQSINLMAIILRYSTKFSGFGASYLKVVEVILCATKSSPKNLYDSQRYWQRLS